MHAKIFNVILVLLAVLGCAKEKPSRFVPEQLQRSFIRGGEKMVDPEQRAATVALIDFTRFSKGFACSGSYIGNDRVLTAGHCLHPTLTDVEFNYHGHFFKCPVTRAVTNYVSVAKDDIAVLTIACPDPDFVRIKPYKLNPSRGFTGPIFSAGFGLTEMRLYSYPDLYFLRNGLRFEPGDIFKEPGVTFIQKFSFANTNPSMIAQRKGELDCYHTDYWHDTDRGDSGGPSYVIEADGTYTLVGIHSHVYAPDFFMSCATNVAHYLDWILKQ